MARTFGTSIDLTQNSLLNARIHNLAADPGSGVVGQVYYNTVSNKLRVCIAATPTWADVAVNMTVGGDLTGTLPNPTIAANAVTVAKLATSVTLASIAAANASAGAITASSQKITNLALPTATTDAATKGYVDNITWEHPVRAAATTNINIASPGTTIDGVALSANDRILLTGQTSTLQNGIWFWTASGSALTRPADFATTTVRTEGELVSVAEGTANAKTLWVLTTAAVTVDTTNHTWATGGATGTAGGDLTGTYPNPTIAAGVVTVAKLATSVTLNSIATANAATASITASSQKIINLADPTAAQDAMTKNYADANYMGLATYLTRDWKDSVRLVSTTNVTISSGTGTTVLTTGASTLTLDGSAVVNGDRVLLAAQTTTGDNGIFLVSGVGTTVVLTRTTDADTSTKLTLGTRVYVESGSTYGTGTWAFVGGTFTGQTWVVNYLFGGGINNASIRYAGTDITVQAGAGGNVVLKADGGTTSLTADNNGRIGLGARTTPAAAIDLPTSTATTGGIAFGSAEFFLYRSAANTLKLNATTLLDLTSVAATDQGASGKINFGTTSSDVLIKKSSTGIMAVRLGNDSADAGLNFAAGIASGSFQVLGAAHLDGGTLFAASHTIDMGGNVVNSVGTPSVSTDAATKGYVDGLATTGTSWKQPVIVATTGGESFTIVSGSVTVINGTTIDGGIAPAIGQRILVKDAPASTGIGSVGSTQPANGIYVVTNNTINMTVSRASDANTAASLLGATVLIESGTAGQDKVYIQTVGDPNNPITVGTTALTWALIQSGTSIVGDNTYITRSGNTIQPVTVPADPTAGANGSTVTTAAALARVIRSVFKGDGSQTTWTITHLFNNKSVQVTTQSDSTGAAAPIEYTWAPSSANAVVVTFDTAPTAGTVVWGNVIG